MAGLAAGPAARALEATGAGDTGRRMGKGRRDSADKLGGEVAEHWTGGPEAKVRAPLWGLAKKETLPLSGPLFPPVHRGGVGSPRSFKKLLGAKILSSFRAGPCAKCFLCSVI